MSYSKYKIIEAVNYVLPSSNLSKKSGIEWIIFYNYIHKAQEGYYVLVVLCTADTKVSE